MNTLFLTASGPSLLDNDLSLLAGRDVMALNHTVYYDHLFRPAFWTFFDPAPEFARYIPAALHKGIRIITGPLGRGLPCADRLEFIETPGVWHTFELALAAAVAHGYGRVYLLGVDCGPYAGRMHLVVDDQPAVNRVALPWYYFVSETYERWQDRLEIISTGVHHGLLAAPHVPLAEAVR